MGSPALPFLLCIAVAYTIALAIYPVLRRGDSIAAVVAALVCLAVVAGLFIIPPEFRIHRAIASLFCVDLLFRLIDFTRQNFRGTLTMIGWSGYLHFLIPFPTLLVVFGQKHRRLRWDLWAGSDVLRMVLGSIGVTIGFILVFAAQRSYALQASFALDHAVKLFIFVLTIESLAEALCGLERLAGYNTRPVIDRAFLSRTPAEFWRRWNNRVQPWLYWNVFLPSGGRRAPLRGVLATFLFSAVLHELAFAFATSRFTGYQFAFFTIQAPAVIASPALERLAAAWPVVGSMIARAATVLWIAATSIFFFHGVDLIFPFVYVSESWLP
jgi:hypothetical protein